MNRQVVPSMILSVFIVCFFSVLLYDREKPRSAVEPAKGERKREASSKVEPPAAPVPPPSSKKPSTSPAVPAPEASSPKGAEPASAVTPEAPAPKAAAATVVSEPAAEPQKTAPSPPPSAPPEPRGAFTTAKDGESLDDIAVRVYGSADQAESLWRANRDQLPRRNSPIKAGAVLRTPAE
jgi:nucleoid-associated protein YgaU